MENESIYFAIGNVIDHVGSETPGTAIESGEDGYGYYTSSNDGDGDHMIESVSTVGTKTRWSGKINSQNIPDGTIEIHYVVFDKAENFSHEKVDGVVKNNAPRLASLKVWSDYNKDKLETPGEYDTYYYSGKTRKIDGNYEKRATDVTEKLVVCKDGNKAFMTVKGDVTFTPEIIGGNGNLYYSYKTASNTSFDDVSVIGSGTLGLTGRDATTSSYIKEDGDGQSYVEGQKATISLSYDSLTDSTENAPSWFEYTIWDSTPGMNVNSGEVSTWNSLNAKFQVALHVIKTDTKAPKAVIDKFYWNSKDDNSLYNNSRENGHIDLEDDLPNGTFSSNNSGNTGVYDRDPKVSGKITVRGSIYDNVLLKEIALKIENFKVAGVLDFDTDYVKLAEYNKGDNAGWTLTDTANNATIDANHWEFSITDEYNNSNGHKANWVFSWDTAYIVGVAQTDVNVLVKAKDARGDSGNGLESSSTGSTDESDTVYPNNRPSYTMDVVPYITSLTTKLSSLKKTNPSIYNRTAKGHYPVYIYYNMDGTVQSDGYEQFTVNGFNLTADGSPITKTLESSSASGNYTVTINDVPSLNNKNENNAQGSYGYVLSTIASQGDADVYANFYNRQPNGANNNNLTDDVILDIWEFNPKAVQPKSGTLDQPIMKINPTNDKIGFAFADGAENFTMGGKTNGNPNGSNNGAGVATDNRTEYSYHTWLSGYDCYTSIAYAYDSLGNSYGISAGGDINASNSSDRFSFFTGRWGNSQYNDQGGSKAATTKIYLEFIGQDNGSSSYVHDKQRFYSPTLATSVSGTSTNVYLVYYDAMNKEVRFRYGNINTTTATEFGLFKKVEPGDGGKPKTYDDCVANVNIIAGKNTGRVAGKYLGLGVDSHTGSDTVVVTWYDETSSVLWYAYNSSPFSVSTGADSGSEWTVSRVFDSSKPYAKAGQFCQLAVDKNGGVHIAAFDSDGSDLVYAYSPSATSPSFTTCIVDGYAITGANISLDVGVTSAGKAIPYIGYYSSSCVSPKYAYIPEGISSASDVADGAINNEFTGAWEVTVLPTTNTLEMNSKQYNHINVCAWKTTAGVLKAKADINTTNNPGMKSTYSKDGSAYKNKATGQVYANGTANPILGYNIKDGASSNAVEVAQMR